MACPHLPETIPVPKTTKTPRQSHEKPTTELRNATPMPQQNWRENDPGGSEMAGDHDAGLEFSDEQGVDEQERERQNVLRLKVSCSAEGLRVDV